jgi:hypothetical protein
MTKASLDPEFVLITTDALTASPKHVTSTGRPELAPTLVQQVADLELLSSETSDLLGSGIQLSSSVRFSQVRLNGYGNSPYPTPTLRSRSGPNWNARLPKALKTSASTRTEIHWTTTRTALRRWWPAPPVNSQKPKSTSPKLKLTLPILSREKATGSEGPDYSRRGGTTGHRRPALKLTSLHRLAAGNPNVKFGLLRRLLSLQLSNLCRRHVALNHFFRQRARVLGSMDPVHNSRPSTRPAEGPKKAKNSIHGKELNTERDFERDLTSATGRGRAQGRPASNRRRPVADVQF